MKDPFANYDQWKTTDPNLDGPDEEVTPEQEEAYRRAAETEAREMAEEAEEFDALSDLYHDSFGDTK